MTRAAAIAGGSTIEWTDFTFSPWHGCEKVSPGCAHCYAEGVAGRFDGPGLWGAGHGFKFQSDAYWAKPLTWARTAPAKLGRRPRVFCASMADVFEDRPELDKPRWRLFDLIYETPELDWLVLTKRPEFARDWLAGYDDDLAESHPNVWLGASIENSRFTWRADILREIPAAVRFISAEPLLGSLYPKETPCVDSIPSGGFGSSSPGDGASARTAASSQPTTSSGRTASATGATNTQKAKAPLDLTGISWIIIGGESGPKARPFHLEHAREIIHAARCVECGGHGWTVETATVTRTRWEQGPGRDPVPVPYPEPEPYQVECARCFGTGGPAVFVKQLGAKPVYLDDLTIGVYREKPLKLRDSKGGDIAEWPADLRIREFPRSAA